MRAAVRTAGDAVFSRLHLFPDSGQSAVLRQTRPQRLNRLAGLQSGQLQFAVQFLVADADVFLSGDAVQQDVGLHLGHGAVALGGAQAAKVQLAHLLGVHALGRQGAQAALQARVNLLLHQRLGNRKGEALDERGKEPVLGLAFHAAALAAGHVFADAGFPAPPDSRSWPSSLAKSSFSSGTVRFLMALTSTS